MATLNFLKGKIGQFVGPSWRGKDYIKTYAPPGNPRTEGQVSIRNIFQHVVFIAKSIYHTAVDIFIRDRNRTAYSETIFLRGSPANAP
ncbi:MAG: DUF6266 family protein [Treponema sp.]|jgi:hypothetical protein|nr:DUF6266 family protein [Treponema sp.]